MGERDSKYNLEGTIELDEGYFTRNNDSAKDEDEDENQKRGLGSQRKSKVLVMVESEKADNPKPSQKSRKPKSVIRISRCCMAERNPLVFPILKGRIVVFSTTWPSTECACSLSFPDMRVLISVRSGLS